MIRIGTCSWADKSVIRSGEFYPQGVKTAEERLRFYASQFSTVEVDSTYYAIPLKNTVALWTDRTPDNFIFHIKVYGALTGHGVDPKSLPQEIRDRLPESGGGRHVYIRDWGAVSAIAERFLDALMPLRDSGKLGILVFQFPPWFTYSPAHLEIMKTCKHHMGGVPVGVEFRHGSWLLPERRDNVFAFLKTNEITYIAADEPQYDDLSTVPFIPHATTDIAYFRFHGRNKENWHKRGIETSLRYEYSYSDEELRCFITPVRKAAQHVQKTYVMFNNCHGGFAMKNGLRMRELLARDM